MKNKKMVIGCMLGCLLTGAARGDSMSYGVRLAAASWGEGSLEGLERQAGVQFGPTITYRFGRESEWAAVLDARYGSLNRLDRVDVETALHYSLSPLFSVFGELRYLWYNLSGLPGGPVEGGSKTRGTGLGLGAAAVLPLGGSGFFVAANTRVVPMFLTTDVTDDSGPSYAWGFEGVLAYSLPLAGGLDRSSMFFAGGYRHQQMRGGGMNETMQTPFIEIGFRQRL